MTWKPKHEAHAIERVRVMFTFSQPLTSKLLTSAVADVVAKSEDFGFDTVTSAESAIATITIQPNIGAQTKTAPMNGTVMMRRDRDSVVEEVGFRDGVFGYVTSTYGRWENLRNRMDEVILPALHNVEAAADLSSAKLEYWDSFLFVGDEQSADVSTLLRNFDGDLPGEVLAGSSQWHSHIGWFEESSEGPVLINRNIDVVDRVDDEGKTVRALGIYTLADQRNRSNAVSISDIETILEDLHKRALRLLGKTLSKEYCELIGLDLSVYK